MEQQTEYWQSYSDMMAALLLVFMLIIAVAFVQIQKQSVILDKKVAEQEAEREKYLELQKKLEAEREETAALEKDLALKQEQLDKIIGIKADIIQDLQTEFSENQMEISIDKKTGAIRFQSEILFAKNKSDLTENGKKYIRKAIPLYLEILLSEKYVEYVSEIIVEGNCDSSGDYYYNLELSQERARSVAEFCIEVMEKKISKTQMEELLKLMNITGRSNKNVIYNDNNAEDRQASRRVELKFRLKDDQMIEEMLKVLEER